jgi:hypothetical protein
MVGGWKGTAKRALAVTAAREQAGTEKDERAGGPNLLISSPSSARSSRGTLVGTTPTPAFMREIGIISAWTAAEKTSIPIVAAKMSLRATMSITLAEIYV